MTQAADALAAEVRALRGELQQRESELAHWRAHDERRQKTLDNVVAKLARLHALLGEAFHEDETRIHVDHIRAALRDPTP